MFRLLHPAVTLSFVHITFIFSEIDDLYKVPDKIPDEIDGEKFIKNLIDGKKAQERPNYLLFTAPFKICNGDCNINISNFNMLFPIYVGLKKSQTVYKKFYSRDHHTIHSTADNAPFRKSTTKVPFTLCPTCPHDSEEGKRPPSIGRDCQIRVSKVDFEVTYAFKTKNVMRSRKQVAIHNYDQTSRSNKYFDNSYQLPKEKIFRTLWPFD